MSFLTNFVTQRFAWTKTALFAATLLVAAASVAYGFWAAFQHPLQLEFLCREDGIVESWTAFAYLLAGGLFFLATTTSRRPRLVLWGLAALMVFIAGEEISWGQRIVGLETPEQVAAHNVQQELNVHNLSHFTDSSAPPACCSSADCV